MIFCFPFTKIYLEDKEMRFRKCFENRVFYGLYLSE
jgi:hypothetical protein